MTRTLRSSLFAALAFVSGCSAAYADQVAVTAAQPAVAAPRTAIAIAPDKIRAPYDVQIIRENGETLPTYALKDRFYVQGNAGERYILRITNPTAHRVEAVVTVDGLDVIDGEAGDLHKRGYVVPPYGETRVEGFRTSQSDVATFRFSAVDDSYAGKKGKARNVGVVAVALFEEQATQQIIEPAPDRPYTYEDDLSEGAARPTGRRGADAKKESRDDDGAVASRSRAPAHAAKAPAATRPAEAPSGGAGAPMPSPPRDANYDREEYQPPPVNQPARTERPGLGTEYGEQRYSATSFTRFVRATDRPIAIAELRYNDAPGLTALGINVQPLPDAGEIMTRETADPFPGDRGYAMPPR